MESSSIASSTVTESCVSSEAPPPSSTAGQLLEISLISAQDLAPVSKSMQTYAVAWINPNRKRTTLTDSHGHRNPEWTEKFIFRLDEDRLEDAAVTVEIYTVSWFRDVLVGIVRVLISDLVAPILPRTPPNRATNMRFVSLQVRRPCGGPQGKLNMGVALLDSTMRTMAMHNYAEKNSGQKPKHQQYDDGGGYDNKKLGEKIHLWRSMGTGSGLNNGEFASKRDSADNGSIASEPTWDDSDICSDIGPSASIVAADLAMKLPPAPTGKAAEADDTASSILEVMTIEEAKARGYVVASEERWRKAASDCDDDGESELSISSKRSSRRKSDGGLLSCIAYGIEFTIVCGASKKPASSNRRHGGGRRKKDSEVNSA